MDKASIITSLQALEEHVDAYLEHLRLAHQIAQDQKLHDGETIKIQANIDAVNENIAEFNSNSESILKANESVEKEIEDLQIKIADTKVICNELVRGMKLGSSDVSRFSKSRNMWYIGEDITGINWNYSAPEKIISGYVVNKLDKSLKPFEFDANKLPMDEITNELWNTIGSMTASNWIDILESLHSSKKIKNKENIPVNV